MKRRTLSLMAVLLLAALFFGACASGNKGASEQAAKGPATGAPAPPAMDSGSGQKPGENSAAEPVSSSAPLQMNRKIILHAKVDVRIENADEAISTIRAAVNGSGGYVQESRTEGTRQQGRKVTMIMRIPSGSYVSMMSLVASLGEKTSEYEWTNDVTEEFLDLEARISTKEKHLTQLQALYARSGSIKEMMELEQEIARVTAELESMKGRMQFLSNQVAFSTITVGLYEPGVPAPIQAPKTVWDRMKLGFTSSFNGVINFIGNMAVALVSFIPVAVLLGIFGGIVYGVYWLGRKVRDRQQPPAA